MGNITQTVPRNHFTRMFGEPTVGLEWPSSIKKTHTIYGRVTEITDTTVSFIFVKVEDTPKKWIVPYAFFIADDLAVWPGAISVIATDLDSALIEARKSLILKEVAEDPTEYAGLSEDEILSGQRVTSVWMQWPSLRQDTSLNTDPRFESDEEGYVLGKPIPASFSINI